MFLIRPSEYYYVRFIQIIPDYSQFYFNSGPPPDVSVLFHMFLNNYINVCFILLLDKWTDNTKNFGDSYKHVFNVLILTILLVFNVHLDLKQAIKCLKLLKARS